MTTNENLQEDDTITVPQVGDSTYTISISKKGGVRGDETIVGITAAVSLSAGFTATDAASLQLEIIDEVTK